MNKHNALEAIRKNRGKSVKGNVKAPLGQGGRFAALQAKLAQRGGVKNPAAVAAAIGRRKYGASKMAKMSAKGRTK